jgi:hypothetical protein
MTEKLTPICEGIDPGVIFARGFITTEEAEILDRANVLGKVSSIDSNGDREGIWVTFVTEEDRKLYDDDTSVGEKISVVLMNHALCFCPNGTWGRVITGVTAGSSNPVIKAQEQIERFEATHTAYVDYYDSLKKES